jgi:hypothetical protein
MFTHQPFNFFVMPPIPGKVYSAGAQAQQGNIEFLQTKPAAVPVRSYASPKINPPAAPRFNFLPPVQNPLLPKPAGFGSGTASASSALAPYFNGIEQALDRPATALPRIPEGQQTSNSLFKAAIRPPSFTQPIPAPTTIPRDPKTGSMLDRGPVDTVVNFFKGAVFTSSIQQIDRAFRSGTQLRNAVNQFKVAIERKLNGTSNADSIARTVLSASSKQLDQGIKEAIRNALERQSYEQRTTPAEREGAKFGGLIGGALMSAALAFLTKSAPFGTTAAAPSRRAFVPGQVYKGTNSETIIDILSKDSTRARSNDTSKAELKARVDKLQKQNSANAGQDIDLLSASPTLRAYKSVTGQLRSDVSARDNAIEKLAIKSNVFPSSEPMTDQQFAKLDTRTVFDALQNLEVGDRNLALQEAERRILPANQYLRPALQFFQSIGASSVTEDQLSLLIEFNLSSAANRKLDADPISQLDNTAGFYSKTSLPNSIPDSPKLRSKYRITQEGELASLGLAPKIHDWHLLFGGGFHRLFSLNFGMQLGQSGEGGTFARTSANYSKSNKLSELPVERHEQFQNFILSELKKNNAKDVLPREMQIERFAQMRSSFIPVSNALKIGHLANPATRSELTKILSGLANTKPNSLERKAFATEFVDLSRANDKLILTPSISAITGQLQLLEVVNEYVKRKNLNESARQYYENIAKQRGEPLTQDDFARIPRQNKLINGKEINDLYLQLAKQDKLITYNQVERWLQEAKLTYQP